MTHIYLVYYTFHVTETHSYQLVSDTFLIFVMVGVHVFCRVSLHFYLMLYLGGDFQLHCPVWPHRCVTLLSKALRYLAHSMSGSIAHFTFGSSASWWFNRPFASFNFFQSAFVGIFPEVFALCWMLKRKKEEWSLGTAAQCCQSPESCALFRTDRDDLITTHKFEYLYASAHTPLSIRLRPREPGDACRSEREDKSLAASCFGQSIS